MSIKRVKSKLFSSGYGWQIDIRRKGLKRIRQTFQTRELAQQVYDAIVGDHARRKHKLPISSSVTLGALIEAHLAAMRQRGRDRVNQKRAETVLNRFVGIVGKDTHVDLIKTSDMNLYVQRRYSAKSTRGRGGKISPQTINRELSEIKSCLSSAKLHFASLSDYRSPEAPWQEEPTDGRRQTWSAETRDAVLAQLRQPPRKGEKPDNIRSREAVADMFVIALQTGMRAGEVRKLRKSNLDFPARLIIVTSKKGLSKSRSGKTREIPMTPEVYAILKRRVESNRSEWLFPGQDAAKPMSKHNKPFITACRRAGITYGLNIDGGMIFNDARRTAENIMLDAGHQPRAVGDLLGHSPETMAKHYARSTAASRRKAVEATTSGQILDTSTADSALSGSSVPPKSKAKARGT